MLTAMVGLYSAGLVVGVRFDASLARFLFWTLPPGDTMCLGIPGKILSMHLERDVPMGKVDFGGVCKSVCLKLTPEADVGQYVVVHVGFALQVIDADEAARIFEFLQNMDELPSESQS